MDSTVAGLISQIEQLGQEATLQDDSNVPAETRRKLLIIARKLCIALQNPGQIVEEFLFGSADNLLIKIGVDLGIFKLLARATEPVTLQQLVETTGGEVALIERIMRGLASINAVEMTEHDQYRPTKITQAFASPKGDAGARLFYDLVIPGMQPLPKYLATTDYVNPRDPTKLPFNLAFGQELFFQWLPKHPEVLGSFQQWMTAQREGHTSWLDFYPLEEQIAHGFNGGDPDSVLLVDVGGNMGQEILEIKQRYPSLPGRTILQDLPSTIGQVVLTDGLEAMAHDFFTPQPVQGARVYYFRNILHDWDDAKCLAILQHTAVAMKPGYSKILLNEFAISDQDACAFAMRSDLMVMALAGAKERTERQWGELLASAGLKIDRIWTAEPESQSIIEASLA